MFKSWIEMRLQRPSRTVFSKGSLIVLATVLLGSANCAAATEFDMPTVVEGQCVDRGIGGTEMTFELQLSSLVDSSDSIADQWVVRCTPRQRLSVLDYSPKTELTAAIEGAIRITQSEEETDSMGLGIDANYQKMLGGHLGIDDQFKRKGSREYQRIAPLQAQLVSGTIDRGHGVFYKLNATSTSVLEGEKRFKVTFSVPKTWRGGLVDVSIKMQVQSGMRCGNEACSSRSGKKLLEQRFVVAVYRSGDVESQQLAHRLSELERVMQRLAVYHQPETPNPLKQAFATVSDWVDPSRAREKQAARQWLPRVLSGDADPMVDPVIRKMSMSVRVAVLDYCVAREEFEALSRSRETLVSAN